MLPSRIREEEREERRNARKEQSFDLNERTRRSFCLCEKERERERGRKEEKDRKRVTRGNSVQRGIRQRHERWPRVICRVPNFPRGRRRYGNGGYAAVGYRSCMGRESARPDYEKRNGDAERKFHRFRRRRREGGKAFSTRSRLGARGPLVCRVAAAPNSGGGTLSTDAFTVEKPLSLSSLSSYPLARCLRLTRASHRPPVLRSP